jgi:hypothetical protein
VTRARAVEGRSALLLAALLLVLALKGDGHFPLPRATPEPLFQLYVLGLTLAFAAGLVALLRGARPASAADPALPDLRSAAGALALFALLDGVLLWLEARRYEAFGYAWHPWAAVALGLAPALAFAWLAARRAAPRAEALLALAAGTYAGHILYAITSFPLAPARSDRLPLLVAAGRELLAGRDPYATLYHLADGAVPLSYLPGMVAAYLPAAALGCDPRLVGCACTLGAALLLHRFARGAAPAYLALLLLGPYLVYRHDLDAGPALLLLALTWVLLGRRRPVALAAACATLVATSQLLAIPAAAVAVFVWRRDGRRAGLRLLATVAAFALPFLLAFVLPDPQSFARGALVHWTEARSLQSLGFGYWLAALLPLPVLRALQAAAVTLVLTRLPRTASPAGADPFEDTLAGLPGALPQAPPVPWISPRRRSSVFATSALALGLFATLNTVAWTSFYLLVLYLALLALLPRRSLPQESP